MLEDDVMGGWMPTLQPQGPLSEGTQLLCSVWEMLGELWAVATTMFLSASSAHC